MRPDLPSLLPLVCPVCATRSERGRELHTLSLAAAFVSAPDGDVEDGILACDNPACARRFPILDGVPLLVRDVPAYLERYGAGVFERDLHPATAAVLAAAGPDQASWPWLLEHLSIYVDAHWGDRATPPPDGPHEHARADSHDGERTAIAPLFACIATLPPPSPRARTVELGCSLGRGTLELARAAGPDALVVGIDLQLAALRRARRLARGQSLAYARRVAGRHYTTATVTPPTPTPTAAFVCADALAPPLVPAAFDRVVALNLVDAVPDPPQLLSVVDALCAPGGELVLASPYAWQSGIVSEPLRLGADDPAADVRRRFVDGDGLEARYDVVAEAEVPWTLRRDRRTANVYSAHWLQLRKPR